MRCPWKGGGRRGERGLSLDSGEPRFVKKSDLVARGWTGSLIRDLLGEPDRLVQNPVFNSKARMKLWSLARVQDVEASKGFERALRGAKKRKASARKAVVKKTKRAVAWAEGIPISVRRIEDPVGAAIRNYNRRTENRMWEGKPHSPLPATRGCDRGFLDRITVNYLRHEETEYEEVLAQGFGRVGVAEAQQVIRERVYGVIAEAYPDLARECERQLESRRRELWQ